MSNILKTVILLFILVSVDCKLQTESLRELIEHVRKDHVKKMSCAHTMVPEIAFNCINHFQPVNVSEVFCKAAEALKNVPSTCKRITEVRVLSIGLAQKMNCTVDENSEIELKSFLDMLRKFSQCVMRSQ